VTKDSAYNDDYRQLYALATFCFGVASEMLAAAPPTRQTQKALVELLTQALETHSFQISREFLVKEVMLRDRSLVGSWSASPEQLAWLMVHEEMSDFFVAFALHYWEAEPFFVHHVPKAAGTSVNALLREQGWFVAFPQDSFEAMVGSNGALGFASQLAFFEKRSQGSRIYIGGHYNLPTMVRRLKLFGRCRGVTLCRPPGGIISSAIRYVWTRIERGDEGFAGLYGLQGMSGVELSLLRTNMNSGASIRERLKNLITIIMDSRQFSAEYDEIYMKYFYNHEIDTPELLSDYLSECGNLYRSSDLAHSEAATLAALEVSGSLPRVNVSSFSEQQLFDVMGGEDQFATIVKSRMVESERIYKVIAGVGAN
jgi:hypothetical protein